MSNKPDELDLILDKIPAYSDNAMRIKKEAKAQILAWAKSKAVKELERLYSLPDIPHENINVKAIYKSAIKDRIETLKNLEGK